MGADRAGLARDSLWSRRSADMVNAYKGARKMVQLDLRNSITSLAILQVSSIMQTLSPEEALEVLCDDATLLEELRNVHQEYAYGPASRNKTGPRQGIIFVLRKQTHFEKE